MLYFMVRLCNIKQKLLIHVLQLREEQPPTKLTWQPIYTSFSYGVTTQMLTLQFSL